MTDRADIEEERESGREGKRLEDENGTKLQLKLLRELQKFAVEDCACGCEWEWKVKMTQDVDVQFLIKLATAPLYTTNIQRSILDISLTYNPKLRIAFYIFALHFDRKRESKRNIVNEKNLDRI